MRGIVPVVSDGVAALAKPRAGVLAWRDVKRALYRCQGCNNGSLPEAILLDDDRDAAPETRAEIIASCAVIDPSLLGKCCMTRLMSVCARE